MQIVIIYLLLLALLGEAFLFYMLWYSHKKEVALYKMYKTLSNKIRPMRLYFLQIVYNDMVKNECYERAKEIKEIINTEFPEERI